MSEVTEAKETILVDEAMDAYRVVKRLKEEIIRMEADAKEHYAKADLLYANGEIMKNTVERTIGNTIMEGVIALKQIMK